MDRLTVSDSEKSIRQDTTLPMLAGIHWMKYNGALIPANAMPVYVDLPINDTVKFVKDNRALFIRYTSDAHKKVTNWWHMVCREYQISAVSANTRSKIHRGLKHIEVKRVDLDWLAHFGYECHVESYQRYKYAFPNSRKQFESNLHAFDKLGVFDTWVGFHESKLVGYVLCQRENNSVFMHTIDLTPEGLHHYIAYAMLHEILEHYINQCGIPVTNGSRSILHQTDIQDFLIKFGFSREYGVLHIVYRPIIGWIVRILFPFRIVFLHLQFVPLFHKISGVLQQEQLCREAATIVGLSHTQRIVKRTFDIVMSTIGLVALGWLIILCWLLASIDTRQNGIFSQLRIGKNGRAFPIFKIRTMRPQTGITTVVTLQDDPRITKLGAMFRRLKLDELPQLLNVLLGHMSFVGPRPDVASFTDTLQGDDRVILSIRPGITGPATLAFRNEEELLTNVENPERYNREVLYPEKVRINRRYIEEYGFIKDVYYILATVFPRVVKNSIHDLVGLTNK